MSKIIKSEQEMLNFAKSFARDLEIPAVIELIGDVGAGKTTFTRGLAEGLGVTDSVTSPSFTISKRYAFSRDGAQKSLIHYDFYRLPDPGLMSDDLLESLADKDTITVVEWSDSVTDLLPETKTTLKITLNPDSSRTININEGRRKS